MSVLLRGLKQYVAPPQSEKNARKLPHEMDPPIADLAAIVTVTDDGGSSGRLRREYRVLPPGDIRNCMVALAADEALLGRLFQYRFPAGRGLRGHSFGNLFLTALSHVTGDFNEAVRVSGEVLAIRGRIFPSTVQNVSLEALLENGQRVRGETQITRSVVPIQRLSLLPRRVRPLPESLEAIKLADVILLGPGSLYTSVLPNLLIPQITHAIAKSRAICVYVANLMTQPGETQGFSIADHVRTIHSHTRPGLIDAVIVNSKPVSSGVISRYRAGGAEPVRCDFAELQKLGIRIISEELLEEHAVIRHNSKRLALLLLEEFAGRRRSKMKAR